MKIDLEQVLTDVWGKPILESRAADGTETKMTIGHLAATAFLTPVKGDENETDVAAKVKIYRAAKKFADGGTADLTAEEIVEARKRIAKVFHAALAGPALEILDVDPGPKAKA
jgi:hypothetical protein